MWVLYVLAFVAAAALYLTYLSLAIPVAAGVACATYAIGMPIAYVSGLGKVLVARSPGCPRRGAGRSCPQAPTPR